MKVKKNNIVIPKKDFIKEHHHLIKLLDELTKEAKDQKKELKKVVGGFVNVPTLKEQLKAIANENGLSTGQYVHQMLEAYRNASEEAKNDIDELIQSHTGAEDFEHIVNLSMSWDDRQLVNDALNF